MDDARGPERPASLILFGLASVAAAVAVMLAITDGFSVRILGIRVSSHGGVRPALFSLLFAVIAYRLRPRREVVHAIWQRTARTARRLVPWIAPAAALHSGG